MARARMTPVASSIPFDNSSNGFTAQDVQAAIEELNISYSPSFSWGRSGNVITNTWLLNDGVSSNISGRFVFVNSPKLVFIYVTNKNVTTYTIGVYQHDGNNTNLTLLDSLTVNSARGGFKVSNVAVTPGKQLAIRLTSGSATDVVAGVILKGSN